MPTPITSTTTAPAAATTAKKSSADLASKLHLDSDAFLKLLIAQLKHQDPTNPLDPTAMMAQTAQLAVVDRMEEMVKLQGASTKASQVGLAASMIGKTATYIGTDGQQATGAVEAVSVTADGINLVIGGKPVALDSVIGIKPAPAAASAQTPAALAAAAP